MHAVAPDAAEKDPAPHLAHAVSPSVAPTDVAGQSWHRAELNWYFPIGHTVHAVCPSVSATALPSQLAHTELPAAAAKPPALHWLQNDTPATIW